MAKIWIGQDVAANMLGQGQGDNRQGRGIIGFDSIVLERYLILCERFNATSIGLILHIRQATQDDIPALAALVKRSAKALCIRDYTDEQIDAALRGAWSVDTDLIDDQTYFVCLDGDQIVGCGGWSRRATLFGGNTYASRDPSFLDPKADRAKIRAFFVDPDFVGQDIGLSLLNHCETEARKAGFSSFELMATLTGARFYRRNGYDGAERVAFPVDQNMKIDFIPMTK